MMGYQFTHSSSEATWKTDIQSATHCSAAATKKLPSGRVGDAVVSRGNAGWTTSKNGHPRTAQKGLPQEKTGRGSLLNSTPLPPMTQTVKGLNWRSKFTQIQAVKHTHFRYNVQQKTHSRSDRNNMFVNLLVIIWTTEPYADATLSLHIFPGIRPIAVSASAPLTYYLSAAVSSLHSWS